VPRIDATGSTNHTFIIGADHVTISNLSLINGANGYADIAVIAGKNAAIAYNYLGVLPASSSCVNASITRTATYGMIVTPNGAGSSGASNGVCLHLRQYDRLP